MSGLMMPSVPIEVPEDHYVDEDDDKRLWIGNLGSDITEYAILKLLQKFGTLGKMNFVYHKVGPDKGMPRGYCFVSFHTWEAAEKARKTLDGKMVMSRTLHVKWAHKIREEEMVYARSKVRSATASSSSVTSPPTTVAAASAETKIAAIEAKLRLMEQTQENFSLNTTIQPPRGLNGAPQTQGLNVALQTRGLNVASTRRGLNVGSQRRGVHSTRPGHTRPYRLSSRPGW